ncbi:Hypp6142 [Branchiostoma lanceolatum]|uniref:Hypp6142 protein n=1 Tax=Branchiostoma lanceolatum TaxID=7740 RepID=A0A8J9VJ08_BRALA|nr:Hypp6142 [Branchiostoma lanceolatum]
MQGFFAAEGLGWPQVKLPPNFRGELAEEDVPSESHSSSDEANPTEDEENPIQPQQCTPAATAAEPDAGPSTSSEDNVTNPTTSAGATTHADPTENRASSSMAEVRNLAQQHREQADAWQFSIESVQALLMSRFSRLSLKAIEWGMGQEEKARQWYTEEIARHCKELKVERAGLFLYTKIPFIDEDKEERPAKKTKKSSMSPKLVARLSKEQAFGGKIKNHLQSDGDDPVSTSEARQVRTYGNSSALAKKTTSPALPSQGKPSASRPSSTRPKTSSRPQPTRQSGKRKGGKSGQL